MSRLRALQYYILSRLLLAPLMLWTITTVVFILLRASPGDTVDAILGPKAPQAQKELVRAQLGLDQPIWVQYFRYLRDLLHLDLGTSIFSNGRPVLDMIMERFPATVELAVFSMAFALLLGVSIGILAASRPDTAQDVGGRFFGIVTYAMPIFWVGMLLQLIFSVQLGWLPIGARYPISLLPPDGPTGLHTVDNLLAGDWSGLGVSLYYLLLPACTLGLVISGIFERIVRVNLKKSLRADYVEAARARGVPERRVLLAHALKNALIPVVTVMGLTIAAMFGGAVLTEVTFSWPGLGSLLFESISNRDYPVIQGVIVCFAVIVVTASIAIDVINAYIDPRIRY